MVEKTTEVKKINLTLFDRILILSMYYTKLHSCSTNQQISILNLLNSESGIKSLNSLKEQGLIDEESNLTNEGFRIAKKFKSSRANYKKIALENDISNLMAMLSASIEALEEKVEGKKGSPVKIYKGRNLYSLLEKAKSKISSLLERATKIDLSPEEIDISSLL